MSARYVYPVPLGRIRDIHAYRYEVRIPGPDMPYKSKVMHKDEAEYLAENLNKNWHNYDEGAVFYP